MQKVLPTRPGADRAAAALVRVELRDFRNHARLTLDLEPRSLAITGPNGVGKTNLLEAVSMLAPGRGLRRARLADMARDDTAAWVLSFVLRTGERTVRIGTGWSRGGKRRVRIDGQEADSTLRLGELLAVHWLTAAMDGLFNAGASVRRRFLDRLVAGMNPDHAALTANWERASRQRRELLKQGRLEDVWLGSVERAMGAAAVAVAQARLEAVSVLGDAVAGAAGSFPVADIGVRGGVERLLEATGPTAASERLQALWRAARPTDQASGRTSTGPHRSDLIVHHRNRGVEAARCSTGEQKALLISLVLAAVRVETARRGAPPLVLLDEVCAHLDPQRRAALAAELDALGAQIWLTGADAGSFGDFRHVQPVPLKAVRAVEGAVD